ncbi:MAG: ABC transporter family substrate-binding protein [Mycobacterium sp.]
MTQAKAKRLRTKLAATVAVALVAGLALTSCSGGSEGESRAGGNAEVGATSDINPQDPSSLRDGGNLRLAFSGYPVNFNPLHLDGNVADATAMLRATLPRAFVIAADGSMTVNQNYFTDIELTSENPQVVTYTINPDAVWTDGTPITWEDIKYQIEATSGQNEDFLIASPNGSERVGSVERGVDDRQAVITFAKPFSDWRGMFAGNGMLLPRSMTSTPAAFNTAQLNEPGPSAGPFRVQLIDKGAQRIVLERNPDWWGPTPRLDTITYTVLADEARLPALRNDELDATGIANIDEREQAQSTPGISIRRAPGLSWYHFTFNGAEGSILADKDLRLAIMKAIDRQAIANVVQKGLVDNPVPLNNHIYLAGQEGYQDNSAVVAFDQAKAEQELDALGWVRNGQWREKDGQRLVIRDVLYDSESTLLFAKVAQSNLEQIGVQLVIEPKPGTGFFSDFVQPGDFDIAQFSFVGDAFPLASLTQIFLSTGEGNYGKIGSPEIDVKIEDVLEELDPAKAQVLANELDLMLWAEGFSLPMTQSHGTGAYRADLANYGPAGLGDLDYTAIGFMQQ